MFQHADLFCTCSGKFCNGCQQMKCCKAFAKSVHNSDGLRHACKDCDNTYSRSLYSKQHGYSELAYRGSNVDQYVSDWSFQHVGLFCSCSGKYCNGCQQVKCHRAFGKDTRSSDGLRYQCKECINKYTKQNCDGRRETVREHAREYRRMHAMNRRVHKMQAIGSYTLEEWKALCVYYNYTCLCCGRREPEIKLTVDHIVPLARGGTNSIDNIQPLCMHCNQSKNVRIIDYRP